MYPLSSNIRIDPAEILDVALRYGCSAGCDFEAMPKTGIDFFLVKNPQDDLLLPRLDDIAFWQH